MYRYGISLLLIFFLFILSKGSDEGTQGIFREPVITLQPFQDFDKAAIKKIMDGLKKSLENEIHVNEKCVLPKTAYVRERNRYRADTLLNVLRAMNKEGNIMVGLTHRDISMTKNGIKDWGVMGLGSNVGNVCVVSTFRLKSSNKDAQLIKVVLHEIGHTLGLGHCSEKSCYMRDAAGHNPTDEETGFCKRCGNILKNKGLQLR